MNPNTLEEKKSWMARMASLELGLTEKQVAIIDILSYFVKLRVCLCLLFHIVLQVATWYTTNSGQLQKKAQQMNSKKVEPSVEPAKLISTPPQKINIKREGILPQKKIASNVEVFTLDDSGDEDEDFLNRTENLLEESVMEDSHKCITNLELEFKLMK